MSVPPHSFLQGGKGKGGKGEGKGKGKGGGKGGEEFDVMIKNCAEGITDDVVKEHYKDLGAGAISRINWVKNKEDGSFRGLGFIKFTSKELAGVPIHRVCGGGWCLQGGCPPRREECHGFAGGPLPLGGKGI